MKREWGHFVIDDISTKARVSRYHHVCHVMPWLNIRRGSRWSMELLPCWLVYGCCCFINLNEINPFMEQQLWHFSSYWKKNVCGKSASQLKIYLSVEFHWKFIISVITYLLPPWKLRFYGLFLLCYPTNKFGYISTHFIQNKIRYGETILVHIFGRSSNYFKQMIFQSISGKPEGVCLEILLRHL